MTSRILRSRTTDFDEDQIQLSKSVVCDQSEQLEFPSTEFTEIGLEGELRETFSYNEEQTKVNRKARGEKCNRTSSNSTVTANVQLQEILANILSTLQADKIEMMPSFKEIVKEGNEKLKKELEKSAKELERSAKGMRN
jgi:hypothetical protein